MGSATVPVAVFGVAPKTLPKLNGSTNGSGATPEPARGTRALPPIVHPKMKTGKEPFKCGMESAECGVRDPARPSADYADCTDFFFICVIREICG